MKFKILVAFMILFALMGFAAAQTFTPTNGTFAYKEVEMTEINGINFTIPTEFNTTFENGTEMDFHGVADDINISVVDNGTVVKVKENLSKNVTSGKTMMGSVEGYLVDKNGNLTFSYKQDGKLVTIKSRDMSLIIGAIGRD